MTAAAPRILIVEDDALQAESLRASLTNAGFVVIGVADDCATALSFANQAEPDLAPDLALVDVRLTGNIDGITTGRQLFEEHGIPIVFLTAFLDDAVQQGRAFAKGFVNKPYSTDDVIATIRRALTG
ncbi:response regulator [Rhodospirillaceae bacterium SYSU D60014]|jgi:DNA-binding response OmpR family regulator|uniref:response regulator n=1 Tax=Virgifigura deserti TaxID=2268457 RepID=UPI000E670AF4